MRKLIFWVLGALLAAGLVLLYQTGMLTSWFGGVPNAQANAAAKYERPKLIELGDGEFGLQLCKEAIESLELSPEAAVTAVKHLPLPPMIGTVQYDPARLFSIKPRFTGDVTEIAPHKATGLKEVLKNGSPTLAEYERPLKFGDKVKQGALLALFSSRDLGEKKAGLVDGLCSLELSQKALERARELFREGAISLSALKVAERQVQADKNAVRTAERTLRMWKLPEKEIQDLKAEAKTILTLDVERDVVDEAYRWARVEIRAPEFDKANPDRLLTILEMNTNLTDMVDPANYSMPLFKLADLSRLQIWVNPPEEYLWLLRDKLKPGAHTLSWKIRFQADSASLPPHLRRPQGQGQADELELPVELISPSLEPNQHTPMLIGYLPNPEYKYLVGQFVTATIMIVPPEGTVEVPTAAVNPLNGQEYVFIEKPGAKDQFLIRRVSVALSLKNTSYVRTRLTPEQEQANENLKPGEYKIQPLKAGDRVVTRGVVELTAALEELRNVKKLSK